MKRRREAAVSKRDKLSMGGVVPFVRALRPTTVFARCLTERDKRMGAAISLAWSCICPGKLGRLYIRGKSNIRAALAPPRPCRLLSRICVPISAEVASIV